MDVSRPGPRVGIAMAAHRVSARQLALQLASVRAQSHDRWVCVVHADGPAPRWRHAPELELFYRDPRFVWLELSADDDARDGVRKGVARVLSEQVEVVALAHADGRWYPGLLAVSLQAWRSDPEAVGVVGPCHELVERCGAPRIERTPGGPRRPLELSIDGLLLQGCSSWGVPMWRADLLRTLPEVPTEIEPAELWYALGALSRGGMVALSSPLCLRRRKSERPLRRRASWRERWRAVQAAARQAGRLAPLDRASHARFVSERDFGLGLAARGLGWLRRRPDLARVAWQCAYGKAISAWRGPQP